MSSFGDRRLVVLDWSAAALSAQLIGAAGEVVAEQRSAEGLKAIAPGGHEAALMRVLAPWRDAHGPFRIVAAGMVGSRTGWIEMPYVSVPADAADIANHLRLETTTAGDKVLLVPGLTDPAASPFPDVMRGEELVLLGLGLDRPAIVVLPGTHSKWAEIGSGQIRRFQTFVTGEMRDMFTRHSSVAGIIRQPLRHDWAAFERGLAVALDANRGAGLLSRLFSARTGWLAGQVKPEELADYFYGICVGSEFDEARRNGWHRPGDVVGIAGDGELEEAYWRTAEAFGLIALLGPADVALRGALALVGQTELKLF